MYLSTNTTSLMQAMDQDITCAMKRKYRRHYLNEVLDVLESETDLTEEACGTRTQANIKNYSVKSALFNLAASWCDIKLTTPASCWDKLLVGSNGEEVHFVGFDGFEAPNFKQLLHAVRE